MGREPQKPVRIVGQYEVAFDSRLSLVDKISNVCARNHTPDLSYNYREKEAKDLSVWYRSYAMCRRIDKDAS